MGKQLPVAGLIGVVGLAISIVLLAIPDTRHAMAGSYLNALMFWATVTLGCFGLAVLHHTLRSTWSLPLLRLFEAGGSWVSLLLMFLLFIPLYLVKEEVYPWARPDALTHHAIAFKWAYLNPIGYAFRLVLFFGLWMAISAGLRASSRRQDLSGNYDEERARSSWAAPSLLAFFLTITFAVTDWEMSLDPTWSSTMFGFIMSVSMGLSAMGLMMVIFGVNADKEPYRSVVSHNLLRDIGNMTFVMIMLWGYTNISQLIIIWNGNLPDTASFYATRSQMWWNATGMALILGQFFVPFFLLLAPRVKRTPMRIAQIGGWIFVMQIVDSYYRIVPFLGRSAIPTILDLLGLVGIGAIWFAAFASQVRQAPLLVQYDSRLQEALQHAH